MSVNLSLSLQPLGYHHCRTVVSGWQKSEKMRPLLSDSVGEEEREKRRRQHLLEKFEVCCRSSGGFSMALSLSSSQSLTRSHSSVRDLAALAAQPRRRGKIFSEVRDTVQEEEEGNDGDAEDELTMLGYWSNPEAEVGASNIIAFPSLLSISLLTVATFAVTLSLFIALTVATFAVTLSLFIVLTVTTFAVTLSLFIALTFGSSPFLCLSLPPLNVSSPLYL